MRLSLEVYRGISLFILVSAGIFWGNSILLYISSHHLIPEIWDVDIALFGICIAWQFLGEYIGVNQPVLKSCAEEKQT